ncbi:MAG: HRDC domain-containing protein [Planctomycetota bacterium]
MKFELIAEDGQLEPLLHAMQSAEWIAFDTEFVSEFSYYPELCLIQMATPGQLWVIDPMQLTELDAIWTALCDGDHLTLVHAGREEILFCHRAVSRTPQRWFDAQLAAGMVGLEYPAAYGTIIFRLLGEKLSKGETRTDWRRRPLTPSQLEYALNDVLYLQPVHAKLIQRLDEMQRQDWFDDETQQWQRRLLEVNTKERWRRVSGSGNLNPRKLAIVRELWQWREAEAQRRNVPAKRVLRDDLIVELARRESADPEQIRAIRGMQRRDINQHVQALARCISLGQKQRVEKQRQKPVALPKQVDAIAQFLSTALASLCRTRAISPQIVGTMQDVKDLVVYHLGLAELEPPKLVSGWRHDFVGKTLIDAIDGKLSLRIGDPRSEFPISIDET